MEKTGENKSSSYLVHRTSIAIQLDKAACITLAVSLEDDLQPILYL